MWEGGFPSSWLPGHGQEREAGGPRPEWVLSAGESGSRGADMKQGPGYGLVAPGRTLWGISDQASTCSPDTSHHPCPDVAPKTTAGLQGTLS